MSNLRGVDSTTRGGDGFYWAWLFIQQKSGGNFIYCLYSPVINWISIDDKRQQYWEFIIQLAEKWTSRSDNENDSDAAIALLKMELFLRVCPSFLLFWDNLRYLSGNSLWDDCYSNDTTLFDDQLLWRWSGSLIVSWELNIHLTFLEQQYLWFIVFFSISMFTQLLFEFCIKFDDVIFEPWELRLLPLIFVYLRIFFDLLFSLPGFPSSLQSTWALEIEADNGTAKVRIAENSQHIEGESQVVKTLKTLLECDLFLRV